MSTQTIQSESREAYAGGELAALLELFLKALNTNLEPFDSFQTQLDLSEFVGKGVPHHLAITAIKELYRTKPHVIDALRACVTATLTELTRSGMWRGDKFVSPAHLRLLSASAG